MTLHYHRLLLPIAVILLIAACQTKAVAIPATAMTVVTQPDASNLPEPKACTDETNWNEPTAPRHVFGNTWYVGSCGISVLLITTQQGHVLIDSGTDEVAPQVLSNLRSLGVDPHDVHYLLSSHEHLDHVGGSARLQAATGAPLVAREDAVPALRRGRGDRSDPQFRSIPGFAPITNVRELADEGSIEVAGLRLTTHATPGHTPGSTSWTWTSCEGNDCRHMVYADSISAISDNEYRYSDHPEAVAMFRAGLERLAALPCDILLTPHPGSSQQWQRMRGEAPLGGTNGDRAACRAYAAKGLAGLEKRLADERKKSTP